MPFPDLLPDRQYTAPSAADGVGIAVSGAGSWANSSWETLLASAPSDGLLTGITLRSSITGVFFGWQTAIEVDIGVGSTPTVIATFKAFLDCRWYGAGSNEANYLPCPIPIEGITSGEPIKARIRAQLDFPSTTWTVTATYLRLPLSGVLESTANPQYVLPAAGALTLFTAPGVWTTSSWQAYAVGGDRVIVGLVVHVDQAGYNFEVDIGDGTNTVRATVPMYSVFTNGVFPGFVFVPPVRVTGTPSARVRGRIGANIRVGLICVDYPL